MDIILMIAYGTIVLGLLVFIHEGGHFLASRAFGVRVSEFMLGLPGPSIGFKHGETRFGVTCVPLGGYARVCGMEPGEINPHLKAVLATLFRRGSATVEQIAGYLGISDDEAEEALTELVEWGSAVGPKRKDAVQAYKAMEVTPTKRQIREAERAGQPAPRAYALGEPREVPDAEALYQGEFKQQYRSLPFWKRTVILLAGIAVNLLFAILAFILIYSVIGFDYQTASGEVTHMTVDPLRSIQAGFAYIGMVIQAVASLFNPATAAETVSNSASVIGIAIISKSAAEQGIVALLEFTAMISVSLGIMNLIPIPPLDGGRFVVEIYQKIARRAISLRALNGLSIAGVALFLGLFVIMVGQDIQRIFTGFWG